MTTKEQEPNLHERVARLEMGVESVIQTLGEIRQDLKAGFARVDEDMRETRQEIRDLAARMESRFQHMDSRFEHMDMRFDAINSRFDVVHSRLDSWLKWVLGFILSSWLTILTSIWLKR